MRVVLPYNTLVLSTGDCFVEGLHPGSIVRGYHYNEKKIVDFPLLSVELLENTQAITLQCHRLKPTTFCGLTKVLTQGGPTECFKAPFLLGVCQANSRQLNVFARMGVEETPGNIPVYELTWESQDYFLWAEGILVGSSI